MSANSRYAPGGDLYNALAGNYGADGANFVWAAAQTGDNAKLNNALSDVQVVYRGGGDVTTKSLTDLDSGYDNRGTLEIFADNVTTNPLGAAFDGLDGQLQRLVENFFKNPYVLVLAVAAVWWFFIRKK
jgi:hypothetical protein